MTELMMGLTKEKAGYPLLLLSLAGQIDGATRFQKLIFILKQEHHVPLDYAFIRYHYGPFSSELRDDINFFVQHGIIEQYSEAQGEDDRGFPIIKTTYKITDKGKHIVSRGFSKAEKDTFMGVLSKWGNKPLNNVIQHAKSLL